MKIIFKLFFLLSFSFLNAQYEDKPQLTIDNPSGSETKSQKKSSIPQNGEFFKNGKPVLLVVCIGEFDSKKVSIVKREFIELKNNFERLGISFRYVNQESCLSFGNKFKEPLIVKEDNLNKSVIYWDGKTDSEIIQHKDFFKSTEFFSQYLNVDLKSSYISKYEIFKKEFEQLFIWKPNKTAKYTEKKFVNQFIFERILGLAEWSPFFNMDFKNVKTATIYEDGYDMFSKSFKNSLRYTLNFDINGDIKNIKDHVFNSEFIFEYKDNLLYKLINKIEGKINFEEDFFYDGERMVTKEKNLNTVNMYFVGSHNLLCYARVEYDDELYLSSPTTFHSIDKEIFSYSNFGSDLEYKFKFNCLMDKEGYPIVKEDAKEKKSDQIESFTLNNYISLVKKSDLNYQIKNSDVLQFEIQYLNKNLISTVLKNYELNKTIKRTNCPDKTNIKYSFY